MNRIILVLLFGLIFSCKDSNKEDFVRVPLLQTWVKTNIQLKEANSKFLDKKVYKLSRIDSLKPSYIAINNVKINNKKERYKISILVKKGDIGSSFGFRLQEVYPNRVDVVFNLEKGVEKNNTIGDFIKIESVTIKNLDEDWKLCSIITKIDVDYIRVVFGTTSWSKNVSSWESSLNRNSNIFIIPSSIKIERVKN